MKRIKLIILFLFFCVATLFAQSQTDSLSLKISAIQDTIEIQNQGIEKLNAKISNQQTLINQQNKSIEDLKGKLKDISISVENQNNQIETNSNNITKIADDLGTKIQQTEITTKDGISQLDKSISQNRLYWIIVSLIILLLGVLMYLFLKKRIKTSKTDVETQIKNTKKSLEEESLKLDNKLIEVLETQLKLKQEEKQIPSQANNVEPDHSLALKVADEIVRIQKNLSQMDSETKGLKQLSASVKRIQDNFVSNGYELVEMLGKEYNEGMKVIANFVPSEDLETGKQIITRIIKPQVNYKGQMIQSAQIEVSVGE